MMFLVPAWARTAFLLVEAKLGDVLGLSAVHVSRTVQEQRIEGRIRVEDRRLKVLGPEGPRAEGRFQPDHLPASRTVPGLLPGHPKARSGGAA